MHGRRQERRAFGGQTQLTPIRICISKRCVNWIAEAMCLTVGSEMPRLAFFSDSVVRQRVAGTCIVFMAVSSIFRFDRRPCCKKVGIVTTNLDMET